MPVLGFIGGIGPWEMAIVLVIVLILFGAGKLPMVFKSFGEAVKAFRDGQKDDALDVDAQASPPPQISEGADMAAEAQEVKEKVQSS